MGLLPLFAVLAVLSGQETPPQVAVAAAAPTPAAEAAPVDPAEEERLNQVTCRTEPVVGSRFNSRVCMTRREWNQRRDDSRRLAHRLDVQNSNRDRVTAPGH